MASALEGFLKRECDNELAGGLRAEVAAAAGAGYRGFHFNLFDVELFYAQDRVTIVDVASLGYDDAEMTITEFLAALPDVPPGRRVARPAPDVIVPPPPSA